MSLRANSQLSTLLELVNVRMLPNPTHCFGEHWACGVFDAVAPLGNLCTKRPLSLTWRGVDLRNCAPFGSFVVQVLPKVVTGDWQGVY